MRVNHLTMLSETANLLANSFLPSFLPPSLPSPLCESFRRRIFGFEKLSRAGWQRRRARLSTRSFHDEQNWLAIGQWKKKGKHFKLSLQVFRGNSKERVTFRARILITLLEREYSYPWLSPSTYFRGFRFVRSGVLTPFHRRNPSPPEVWNTTGLRVNTAFNRRCVGTTSWRAVMGRTRRAPCVHALAYIRTGLKANYEISPGHWQRPPLLARVSRAWPPRVVLSGKRRTLFFFFLFFFFFGPNTTFARSGSSPHCDAIENTREIWYLLLKKKMFRDIWYKGSAKHRRSMCSVRTLIYDRECNLDAQCLGNLSLSSK